MVTLVLARISAKLHSHTLHRLADVGRATVLVTLIASAAWLLIHSIFESFAR
jgi:hypothetical protein